jgi:protein-S-isoprenylcysteine O-methyltransferase Ste14
VNSLILRALAAFLLLPGVVAFGIPLWVLARDDRVNWWAGIVVVIGAVILLQCVRDFYTAGKGTLAPWSPPRHLVTSGFYRFARNPMYLGVIVILIGWAMMFRSRVHLLYALLVTAAFHARVVLFEEPWLERTHGEEWRRYRAQVRRRFLW